MSSGTRREGGQQRCAAKPATARLERAKIDDTGGITERYDLRTREPDVTVGGACNRAQIIGVMVWMVVVVVVGEVCRKKHHY